MYITISKQVQSNEILATIIFLIIPELNYIQYVLNTYLISCHRVYLLCNLSPHCYYSHVQMYAIYHNNVNSSTFSLWFIDFLFCNLCAGITLTVVTYISYLRKSTWYTFLSRAKITLETNTLQCIKLNVEMLKQSCSLNHRLFRLSSLQMT